MKKIIITVLLIASLSLSLFKSDLFAQEKTEINNLIEVNNLMIYSAELDPSYLFRRTLHLIEPISINVGKTYTLVIGKDFYYEQDWEDSSFIPDPIELKMHDESLNEIEHLTLELTKTEEYVYTSFQATHKMLDFEDIVIGQSLENEAVTEIVLFEGEIKDFHSLISNTSVTEPIKGAYIMNYDDLKTFDELLEMFEFMDNIDDANNLKVDVFYNNFDNSNKDPGVYKVLFSVSDKRFNKIFYELTIDVLDITPPVITGTDYYEVEVKDHDLNVSYILQSLRVEDNHTVLNERDLEIITDDFTKNINKPGDYLIEVMIADSSNNETIYQIMVKVMDTKPPVITGPFEIYRYLNDPELELSDYKALFSSFDEIDGDLTDSIFITGDYDPSVADTYKLKVKSKDHSGNEASKNFRIHVIDGIPPTITTDELIISYETYNAMEREDMVFWLEQQLLNVENIKILYDETLYLKNAKAKTYIYYSYEIDGKTYYSRLAISPAKSNDFKIYSTIIGFITINIIFSIAYIVRFKRFTSII